MGTGALNGLRAALESRQQKAPSGNLGPGSARLSHRQKNKRDLVGMLSASGDACPQGLREESILKSESAKPKAGPDYYRLLAGRLEALLDDLERLGTAAEDDLVRRLRSLLDEARAQI